MDTLQRLYQRDVAQSDAHPYADYHARRFAHLLATARRVAPRAQRVLDVGYGPFTEMAAAAFPQVWTLGFAAPGRLRHIDYDINAVQHGVWPQADVSFDLIIFAEVVEHLHVPAAAALAALKTLLAPGGLIVLQTPNAAEVMKRVALLRGRQPYERLRMTPFNPGHIHEYTLAELVEEAHDAGLAQVESEYRDDLPAAKVAGFHPVRYVLDRARKWAPALRGGITLVLRAAD